MVKTEDIDLDLREIGRLHFNFTWYTGCYPKWYRKGIDLLINKYPEDQIPHKLMKTILFDIKANLHIKNLGRNSMNKYEEMEGLAPEQYGSRA